MNWEAGASIGMMVTIVLAMLSGAVDDERMAKVMRWIALCVGLGAALCMWMAAS